MLFQVPTLVVRSGKRAMSTSRKTMGYFPLEVYPLVVFVGGAVVGAGCFAVWNLKKSLNAHNVSTSAF
jgi:hypothetical protein